MARGKGRGKTRADEKVTDYDSGPIEPVNLFGRTGGERFEEMFCNPSSSHPQADSSGAKASSQSVDPPAAEAEGIAVSQDESHPAFFRSRACL